MLDILQVQRFVPDQSKHSSWAADHNVRAVVTQRLLVTLDADTTEENGSLHAGHVLSESVVLAADLVRQLSSVAETHDTDLHRVDNKKRKEMLLDLSHQPKQQTP